MYGDTEDDRPTMGILWYARQVRKWLLLVLFCWQLCCFVWPSLYFLLVYIINFVQKSWAHVQSRRSYPEFVAEFDRLTPEDVVWEPYSQLAINTRAPFGISSVCSQDQGLWMTTTALVYDVYIEAHCPDRVRRQFGQRQLYPVLSALDRVQRHDHR